MIRAFTSFTEINQMIRAFTSFTETNQMILAFTSFTEINQMIRAFTSFTEINQMILAFTSFTEINQMIRAFTSFAEIILIGCLLHYLSGFTRSRIFHSVCRRIILVTNHTHLVGKHCMFIKTKTKSKQTD